MRALTWQGKRNVRVETVPDPRIAEPTDAVIRITSTAICGSDLHLYEVLGPYLEPGDILGHEPMGVVEEVGADVTHIAPGDRVVVPFNISCGSCWMCSRQLYAQCETTQVREQGKGAALLGYTSLYGSVPGGQAEYLRVPQAHFGPIKVPDGPPDPRFLYLSDVLPTAWQAVAVRGRAGGRHAGRARPRPGRPAEHPDRPVPTRSAHRGPRHPRAAVGGCAPRLPAVPAEAGFLHQGAAHPVSDPARHRGMDPARRRAVSASPGEQAVAALLSPAAAAGPTPRG